MERKRHGSPLTGVSQIPAGFGSASAGRSRTRHPSSRGDLPDDSPDRCSRLQGIARAEGLPSAGRCGLPGLIKSNPMYPQTSCPGSNPPAIGIPTAMASANSRIHPAPMVPSSAPNITKPPESPHQPGPRPLPFGIAAEDCGRIEQSGPEEQSGQFVETLNGMGGAVAGRGVGRGDGRAGRHAPTSATRSGGIPTPPECISVIDRCTSLCLSGASIGPRLPRNASVGQPYMQRRH